MQKQSAGLLIYRIANGNLQVVLAHPGGPFWAKKDAGAWSIPKGEFADDEDALAAAFREVKEELGVVPEGEPRALAPIVQKNGKKVFAWAVESDVDVSNITSNTFLLEWPPRSGKMIQVPEVDRAEWFGVEEAKTKVLAGQEALIDELAAILADHLRTL